MRTCNSRIEDLARVHIDAIQSKAKPYFSRARQIKRPEVERSNIMTETGLGVASGNFNIARDG